MTSDICSTEIGIAIAGSVDSGKSTFVGVLTTGKLDDGDGSARTTVAKHPHEIASNKTSDISTKSVYTQTNQAITLFDLCGHEKYFKTTAYGIAGHYPDYSFVIIGANKGILPMTKQHITLLYSMNVPMIFIITRFDITPQNIYNETIKMINAYSKNILKIPVEFINSPYNDQCNDTLYKIEKLKLLKQNCNIEQNRQLYIPVITVSNKTGYYIDFVHDVLKTLTPRNIWNNFDDDISKPLVERCRNKIMKKFINNMDNGLFVNPKNNSHHVFFVDTVYNPVGIGIVITGMNRGGVINEGDTLYLGPFGKEFKPIRVKSINNYVQQRITSGGDHQRITIAIATSDKDVNKKTVKKGMVLLKNKDIYKNYLSWRFTAVITVFSHSATLKNGYTPSLQIGNIRQGARMILDPTRNQNKDYIKSKDFATVTFKFKQRAEYIEPYQLFIFRCGGVHGIGMVIDNIPIANDSDPFPDPVKLKRTKKHIV